MRLRCLRLEKAVRARVRAALRADRPLRRQARRAPRLRWSERPWARVTGRLLLSALLGLLIAVAYRSDGPLATQSAVGALWFLSAVLIGRFRLLRLWYDLPALTALTLLPVSKDLVLGWERQRVLRQGWRLGADALALLGVLAATHGASLWGWAAVGPLAALTACAALAMSVWLMLVRVPPQVVWLPFLAMFVGTFFVGNETLRPWLGRMLAEHGETLSLLSPGGWVARAYLELPAGDSPLAVSLLGLSAAVGASLAWGLRRVEQAHDPEKIVLQYSFGEPADEGKPRLETQVVCGPQPSSAAEVRDAVAVRPFLQPSWPTQRAGWIERWVQRWLTLREKVVLEAAILTWPAGMRQAPWTRGASAGAALAAVGLGLCWLQTQPIPGWPRGIALCAGLIALVTACSFGLPFSLKCGSASGSVTAFGVSIPCWALLPVTAGELGLVALKVGVVRALVFAPVMAVGGALLGAMLELSPIWGAVAGLKCTLLSVVAIPWWQAAQHSTATNEANRWTWRTPVLLVILGTGLLGLIGGGLATLFGPGLWSVLGLGVATVTSFGSALAYAELHNRLWLDLTRAV